MTSETAKNVARGLLRFLRVSSIVVCNVCVVLTAVILFAAVYFHEPLPGLLAILPVLVIVREVAGQRSLRVQLNKLEQHLG